MNPLFLFQDCFGRIIGNKRTLIVFLAISLVAIICGICFVRTPAMYEYHLTLCNRFVARICYSDRSVFVIFLERTAGHALLLLIVLAGGMHPALIVLPVAVNVWRMYTLGGSLVIFFEVFGFSGALVVFILYLPVHLFIDCVLISGTSLSCGRARHFCFRREDFTWLLKDFALLICCIALICLIEMVLLLALFHPIGNIL